MYKITVDDKSQFTWESSEGEVSLDGSKESWDLTQLGDQSFSIIKNNLVYNVEVVAWDQQQKQMQIKINGSIHSVAIQDKMDLLLAKMGIDQHAEKSLKELKAPMPGLILDIVADLGAVKKGDPLIILEAMKMENVIKAPADAIISKINVNKGESVEKNAVLIEF